MRVFLLALALSLPLTLTACTDSAPEEAAEEAVEEGAPAGDMEDVIGDGEIIDEPGEPEGNALDPAVEDGMSTGAAVDTVTVIETE